MHVHCAGWPTERDTGAGSLNKRADEIDQIAEDLDRYIKSREDHG